MKKLWCAFFLMFASSLFSQEGLVPLEFIGSKEDVAITETTNEASFFSSAMFNVNGQAVRARLRKVSVADGALEITWRIPSIVSGKLAFTPNDKVWREKIGVVDCKLELIEKKILRVVPAKPEKLVEEK